MLPLHPHIQEGRPERLRRRHPLRELAWIDLRDVHHSSGLDGLPRASITREVERPLESKLVLVTGAGVRLGRAIAEGLARAGASIAAHYHSSAGGAEEVLDALRAQGVRAQRFQADLAQAREAEELVARVEAELGPIHALVNSAALFDRADFVDTPIETLDRLWAVNARGPFALTQAVARRMIARGEGDVVNVLDIGGALVPWAHYSAYCMSKAALAMLTRCLALELAPAVRVNGVAPGTVLPPEGMDEGTLASIRSKIPQGRFGGPKDVVEAVQFLLTGPRFITGQILAIDGGRSLGTRSL
jgi:pteridine reductase